MIRTSMKGRELTSEEIKSYKEHNNVSNIAYTKEPTVNRPTTQVGYNENCSIKEVNIKPHIYELNNVIDTKYKINVKGGLEND
ncbi:hypothetical protein M2651_04850 [Clostridium sp. SYSU_GA19001]|uniref:hypothetical protein n=1 Tax=Clostridium caldaquaticum TaxID=2940653 RepID=UPI0020771E52|nr:hypothetical protein [Clostridium caldaquaticum]MCM8710354.1 hypothetical protein [Clostridium caldaquaticum]